MPKVAKASSHMSLSVASNFNSHWRFCGKASPVLMPLKWRWEKLYNVGSRRSKTLTTIPIRTMKTKTKKLSRRRFDHRLLLIQFIDICRQGRELGWKLNVNLQLLDGTAHLHVIQRYAKEGSSEKVNWTFFGWGKNRTGFSGTFRTTEK